ncbi:YdeI/OmpD-associated family protein [Lysobacter niastensis]|uniref:YdeI/OmpD-associated family protein n=1 Tax=Lysobacter niastensis TaxID=380629 RepID=A0ABS0BCE2_9GAMM|nr:YdeI/OmpD-associated family protein [Lysobacter niastensis]MBF6024659.1 YdeI/OmpD-associated family protein [Lysobacter niastensis]
MAEQDPRIDAYIAKAAEFARPILTHLRAAVHAACPEVVETLKWGAPSFTYRGKILCSMAAFKQHAAFGFWQGAQVVGGADAAGEGMGQFGRLTRISDLPGKRELTGYLRQAMQLIDSGATRTPANATKGPKPALEVPPDLAAALAKNAKANATFEGFAPSYRRDYIEWITEAKREDTRKRRLEQTVEWLAEGKPRNWKYMNC